MHALTLSIPGKLYGDDKWIVGSQRQVHKLKGLNFVVRSIPWQKAALRQRICANTILDVPSGPGPTGESKSGGVKSPPVAAVGSDVGLSGYMTAEERVYEAVVKEAAKVERVSLADVKPYTPISTPELMLEAYDRCGEVCGEYAKTFYLGEKEIRYQESVRW